MDVSNTGLYDGASATAEGVLMAARVTKRKAVAVLEPFHPNTLDVIRTYASGVDLRIDTVASLDAVRAEHACVVAQQLDYYGAIQDVEAIASAAHAVGALCVIVADPAGAGAAACAG